MMTTEKVLPLANNGRKPWQSWLQASRPKTLTVATIPALSSSALAYAQSQKFSLLILVFSLLCSYFIQIGTNLINDALDFHKGADTEERLGPLRVTQMGILSFSQVFGAGLFCFLLAFLLGLPLILTGGIPIFFLLAFSIICGYLYTGGPYPLAYVGLGDVFVLLFFGWLSILGVYYLQTGTLGLAPLLLGFQIGCLATAILAVNNLRDVNGDKKAHKQTFPVRYGIYFAKWEITLCILAPFAVNACWLLFGQLFAAVFPLTSLPIGIWILLSIWRHEPSDLYNRFFAHTALLHLCFGVLLAIGFLL